MSLNVELLEQSFNHIKPNATKFSATFYDYLFAESPDIKTLFAHTNMTEQRDKLMASLILVVENLRTPEVLTHTLKGLGAKHVQYGAYPSDYPIVGAAILKTFEYYLGADWTPEVKQAWVEAYGAITSLMLEGADYSEEELKLPT